MKLKRLLSDGTIAKIRKMIEAVKAHPETYRQDVYPGYVDYDRSRTIRATKKAGHICGTSFCAAGHIVYAKSPRLYLKLASQDALSPYSVNWRSEATKELGKPFEKFAEVLEDSGTGSRGRIFGSEDEWPLPFTKLYDKASKLKTNKGRDKARARAFEARWEAFIKSDGRDIEYDYYGKAEKLI